MANEEIYIDVQEKEPEPEPEPEPGAILKDKKIDTIVKEIADLSLELDEDKEEEEKQFNNHKKESFCSTPPSTRSNRSGKSYEFDFDYLVYNDDSETDEEYENEQGVITQCWTKTKKYRLQKCLWKLKYNRIISTFYLDDLKRREVKWSWMIIVISTITSGLTVANNVDEEPIEDYNTIVNISLTISSMTTSLIAAWIKKQGFVEKINEIDKYLVNINSLCEELEVQFLLLEKDRLPYKEFKDKYIPEITKYVTSNPLIPPKEWKECAKEITLKYPQLIEPDNNEENKLWPWFGDLIEVEDENGEPRFVRRPTKFMNHMLKKDRKSRLKSSCCIVPEIRNSVYK